MIQPEQRESEGELGEAQSGQQSALRLVVQCLSNELPREAFLCCGRPQLLCGSTTPQRLLGLFTCSAWARLEAQPNPLRWPVRLDLVQAHSSGPSLPASEQFIIHRKHH
ncbi:hypothetical protein AAFF_G00259770 [Aldrovandia affinis]|uniref:Uncharacterized protein n=1 Tax=Aldrovandia affinis TaxID=143900 RepID=A0AAD7W2W0_9TELE|nr:hypothetical protein AAFF_G00259770 [Aldrovandia affinis]